MYLSCFLRFFLCRLKKIFLLGITLLNFIPAALHAKEMNLIFLYPGGEGSEAQAQPVLDEFAAALKQASGNKIEAKVRYFSDLSLGKAYIEKQRPVGGILAYDVFLSQGETWQAKPLLQTRQLPSADGQDQYFLIGNKQTTLPTSSGLVELLVSQPLSTEFVKEKLFPGQELQWQIKPTQNILGKLRNLGMNPSAKNEWILLTQFEWNNIHRLKAAWVAGLKVFLESQKIPSAPFVILGDRLKPEEISELKSALENLSQSPEGKNVLQLLRLEGFAPVS